MDLSVEPAEPSLKSGLTEEMEAVQIATPAKSEQAAKVSPVKAIIEIADSPPPPVKDKPLRFDTAAERALRIERLRFLQ